jgi:hypothetical protein
MVFSSYASKTPRPVDGPQKYKMIKEKTEGYLRSVRGLKNRVWSG